MNLIEGLFSQMNRVRDIIKTYEEVGPAGAVAAAMMKVDIKKAEDAIACGDTIQMMVCYTDLETWEE